MTLGHARKTVSNLLASDPDCAAAMAAGADSTPGNIPTHEPCKRAEYRIVAGINGIVELELKVNDLLDQGWKLIGGLSFDRGCAYQAMARVTREPVEPRVPPPTLGQR